MRIFERNDTAGVLIEWKYTGLTGKSQNSAGRQDFLPYSQSITKSPCPY